MLQINFLDEDGFAVVGCLGQDAAKGVGDKRSAPELKPNPGGAIAANVSNFVADAVNVVGFDPFARLVDYLVKRAS